MAISARTASLLARRGSYNPYSSTGKIKLLTPSNNAIASIAKQTANNELSIMVQKYNAGQVSNSDFKAFLVKMQANPGISEVDRNDIALQIQDFDSKIQGDRLIANYNAAPDNTLQQLQAAQAVSNYYKSRATSLQPDTPNYTDAVNAASKYDSAVVQIQKNVNLKAQRALRYQQEQEINKIAGNTSEKAMAKADKWKALYDLAISQDDQESAAKYAASYNQELTNSQTLGDKEITTANKKQLNDFINTTINDYHSGKITGDQAIQQLQQADQFAADSGDTSSQIRLQSLYTTISREVDKGITYSANGGFGDKTKGGGTGGGDLYLNPDGSVSYGGSYVPSTSKSLGTKVSSGGIATAKSTGSKTTPKQNFDNGNIQPKSLSQLDIEYKNALNEANKALVNGEITAQQYEATVTLITKSRQVDLQNVTTGLQEIMGNDPKAKIGGKQISTLLDKYSGELQNVTTEYNGLRTGNLVLSMGNKNFTDPTGQTISKPTLEFVPKSKVADSVNVEGIYYKPRADTLLFNDETNAKKFASLHSGLTVQQDQNGKFFLQDASGNVATAPYLDITDTNGNVVTYQKNDVFGGNWLPVGDDPQTAALRNQIIKEIGAKKDGQDYQSKILNYNQLQKFVPNTPVGTITGQVKPTIGENISNAIKPVTQAIENIPNVVAPLLPKLPSPVQNDNQQLNIPSNTSVSQPTFKPTTPTVTPQVNIAPKPLSLAGAVPKTAPAIQQAVNPSGAKQTQIKIAPPPAPNVDSNPILNVLKKIPLIGGLFK